MSKTIAEIMERMVGPDKSDKGYELEYSDWFRIEGYNAALSDGDKGGEND